MGLDKGKIIGIVQLGFSLLAFILSIVALAGGVADNVDGLKSACWMSMESSGINMYTGWSHACLEAGPGGQSHCGENDWDQKDATTAMGALSFLFALANLVLVAVKLFEPNKMHTWASSRCSQAWRPPRLLVGSDRSLPRACATRPPRSKGCGASKSPNASERGRADGAQRDATSAVPATTSIT